jgi:hypothetical protein
VPHHRRRCSFLVPLPRHGRARLRRYVCRARPSFLVRGFHFSAGLGTWRSAGRRGERRACLTVSVGQGKVGYTHHTAGPPPTENITLAILVRDIAGGLGLGDREVGTSCPVWPRPPRDTSPTAKQPGHDAYHSLSTGVDDKKNWVYTFTSTRPRAMVLS